MILCAVISIHSKKLLFKAIVIFGGVNRRNRQLHNIIVKRSITFITEFNQSTFIGAVLHVCTSLYIIHKRFSRIIYITTKPRHFSVKIRLFATLKRNSCQLLQTEQRRTEISQSVFIAVITETLMLLGCVLYYLRMEFNSINLIFISYLK